MRRFSMFLVVAVLVAGIVACGGPVQYSLTISAMEGGEITTPSEGTSSYEEGTEVPLVAFPHSGYRFVNWTGDVGAVADINAASTTVTMNGDYSITANFVRQYVLTIDSTDGGEVTDPGEGAFNYDEGTIVILEASPDTGYRFVSWTGDVGTVSDVSAAVTTITMDTDCAVTISLEEDEVVTFVDCNLEATVRQAIDVPERTIYARDMEGLTIFRADNMTIFNLAGLEYASHLKQLYLWGNQISDITSLAHLTNLTILDLGFNQISDISPLADLTNLTELSLYWNRISDISPLANLTRLQHLEILYNQIGDISPLANLINLIDLHLEGNQISDISPLVENQGILQGDQLALARNPLSSDSVNIYIPELEARGVTVTY